MSFSEIRLDPLNTAPVHNAVNEADGFAALTRYVQDFRIESGILWDSEFRRFGSLEQLAELLVEKYERGYAIPYVSEKRAENIERINRRNAYVRDALNRVCRVVTTQFLNGALNA